MNDDSINTEKKVDDSNWAGCDLDDEIVEPCGDAPEPVTNSLQVTDTGLEVTVAGNSYHLETSILIVVGIAIIAGCVILATALSKVRK